jgi:hypothetical protein
MEKKLSLILTPSYFPCKNKKAFNGTVSEMNAKTGVK